MNTNTETTTATGIFTLKDGPFAGISAEPSDIVNKIDAYGTPYAMWETHARTRKFLELFNPLDGWKVVVTQSDMQVKMEDVTLEEPGNGELQDSMAWLFDAKLLDKNDVVVANASVCQLLNCPMAIEIGQTRARGKLYQALGLPGSPGLDDLATPTAPVKPQGNLNRLPQVVAVVDDPQAIEQAPVTESTAQQVESQVDVTNNDDSANDVESETSEVNDIDVDGHGSDAPAADHDIDDTPDVPAVSVQSDPVQTNPAQKDAKGGQKRALDALMRQIKIRANAKGVDVPNLETVAQASAFLATLVTPPAKADLLGDPQ